jgi:hypothetical protein
VTVASGLAGLLSLAASPTHTDGLLAESPPRILGRFAATLTEPAGTMDEVLRSILEAAQYATGAHGGFIAQWEGPKIRITGADGAERIADADPSSEDHAPLAELALSLADPLWVDDVRTDARVHEERAALLRQAVLCTALWPLHMDREGRPTSALILHHAEVGAFRAPLRRVRLEAVCRMGAVALTRISTAAHWRRRDQERALVRRALQSLSRPGEAARVSHVVAEAAVEAADARLSALLTADAGGRLVPWAQAGPDQAHLAPCLAVPGWAQDLLAQARTGSPRLWRLTTDRDAKVLPLADAPWYAAVPIPLARGPAMLLVVGADSRDPDPDLMETLQDLAHIAAAGLILKDGANRRPPSDVGVSLGGPL